jgi:hypothetical protein
MTAEYLHIQWLMWRSWSVTDGRTGGLPSHTTWIGTQAEVPFARDLGRDNAAGTVRLASAFLATTN